MGKCSYGKEAGTVAQSCHLHAIIAFDYNDNIFSATTNIF